MDREDIGDNAVFEQIGEALGLSATDAKHRMAMFGAGELLSAAANMGAAERKHQGLGLRVTDLGTPERPSARQIRECAMRRGLFSVFE